MSCSSLDKLPPLPAQFALGITEITLKRRVCQRLRSGCPQVQPGFRNGVAVGSKFCQPRRFVSSASPFGHPRRSFGG